MTGGSTIDNNAPFEQKFCALCIVVASATLGGFILRVMQNGYGTSTTQRIKPCMPKKIAIPPLVGMILFGGLARNLFEAGYPDIYSEYWADWIR